MAKNNNSNLGQQIFFGIIILVAAVLAIGFLFKQLQKPSNNNVTVDFNTSSAATSPELSVSPTTTTVKNSTDFTVNVRVDTFGYAADAVDLNSLRFNPAVVQVLDDNASVTGVQITPGTLLPVNAYNSVDNTAGTIQFSQVSSGGTSFTGNGILATIRFRSIAGGTANLTFDFTVGSGADSNISHYDVAQGRAIDVLGSVINGSVTVDATGPTVSMSAPANGATVSGSSVVVSATASDTGGSNLAGVQFKLDGANLQAEDTTSPYSITWNTIGVSNGAHILTATARDNAGNLTTTANRNITVSNISFDYSLSNGGNKSVQQGAATTNTVTATLSAGTTTGVTYTASGLPTGAAASFSPTSCSPTCTTTMTISTAGSTPVGASTITVTGNGGSVTRTTTFTLTVTAIPFDFTLSNGGNKSLIQGASTTNTVTATLSSGATTGVTYTASGLPTGASASFSPTSCNPTCTTTMTINTAGSTPAGASTVTVTGTGGSLTRTTTFTLTVTAANQVPLGNVDDVNSAYLIRGWAFDPDSSATSIQVQVYMDGPAGTGTLISTVTANVDRPDIRSTYGITGNHGYQVTVPSTYQNSSPHTVYVYAIDTSSTSITVQLPGSNKFFTTRTITIDPEGQPTKVLSGTLAVLNSSKGLLRNVPFTSNTSGQAVILLDLPSQTVYFKVIAVPFLTRMISGIDLGQFNAPGVVFSRLLAGDLTPDNIINSVDYSVLNTNWFTSNATADINKDGIVNSIDFSYMNQHWLMTGEQ